MIQLAICDDRMADIQKLLAYAGWFTEKHPEIPLKAESFTSPYELLQAVNDRGGFDLYLLDVLMPHLSGIDIARRIRKRGETAEILFLTTSREYALEAFGVKAAGYLVKPVSRPDFELEVLHCIHNLAPRENPAIPLKTREGIRRVHIQELVMVESFNHDRVCTLADGTMFKTPVTLSSLYEKLKEYPCFFLPHRAYIVNFNFVNGLTQTELLISNRRRVPISRNKVERTFHAKKRHLTQEMSFFCVVYFILEK